MAHKLLGPIIGAGLIGAEYGYNYLRRQWTGNQTSSMAYTKRKFVPRGKRAVKRPMRYSRPMAAPSGSQIVSYKRATLPETVAVASGAGGFRQAVSLNQVFNSDILGAYDLYRIKRVTLKLIPKIDTGASLVVAGATPNIANNDVIWVVAACDPADENIASPTTAIVSKFNNFKLDPIRSGGMFTYYFYPKASNQVTGAAGVSRPSGSYGKFNPWLRLDADGITIPHFNCICGLQTGYGTLTASYTYTFTVEFDCMLTR